MSELATAVFAAESGTHLLDAPRSARFAAFLRAFDERAYLRGLRAHGFAWIARGDPSFPRWLSTIHDPPPGIFVRGRSRLDLDGRPTVAIVGARACSAYGSTVAAELARELARAGVVVVSGLARGIDAAAHRGALERGTTLAVLGCGIDRDYPRAHASLAAQVAEHGWIVSEYPPGVEPAPWRFPARNRIVAGLSQATVVVEARERSGALITADLALDEGREVLAVPGEITSNLSSGTNALLRLGATPVTCAADVLGAVGVEPPSHGVAPELTGELESVRALVADGAVAADEIVQRSGLAAGAVAAALAELELLDVITHADGLYREVMRASDSPR
jgi:DNA processing protein